MGESGIGFDPKPAAERAIRLARKSSPILFSEGEVGDLERDALVAGLPLWFASRSGYLYLAANASWVGLYKIGCTRKTVEARMAQLSDAGVPTPWLAVASWSVYDAHGLEALAHRTCKHWHVTGEMFNAPYADLVQRISECIVADRTRLELQLGRHLMPGMLGAMFGEVVCQVH